MQEQENSFEMTKSFGLGVLLKLTQKSVPGIKISSNGKKFTSNVALTTLKDAVESTMETHHIRLKIK